MCDFRHIFLMKVNGKLENHQHISFHIKSHIITHHIISLHFTSYVICHVIYHIIFYHVILYDMIKYTLSGSIGKVVARMPKAARLQDRIPAVAELHRFILLSPAITVGGSS